MTLMKIASSYSAALYFRLIKPEYITTEPFFFPLAFLGCSSPLNPGEKSACITSQQHAGNKHPDQTRKCGARMHHFPGVSRTERLSSCNFRQPCKTHPYSAELYGKFDSLPKGGVDRYYEDHVPR